MEELNMEELELICFEMISSVGSARSSFVEAIQSAKNKDFEKAVRLLEEGKTQLRLGHQKHSRLIQKEAAGSKTEVNLLLLHTEDQMMSAEVLELMATEFLALYRTILS